MARLQHPHAVKLLDASLDDPGGPCIVMEYIRGVGLNELLQTNKRFTPARVEKLLLNPGIIRNRAKVESTVRNARLFLDVRSEFGSFDAYIWGFVGGRTLVHKFRRMAQLPAVSPESEAFSADLRRRGFRFVGPTVCYAHLQASGLINDHVVGCFRYAELTGA